LARQVPHAVRSGGRSLGAGAGTPLDTIAVVETPEQIRFHHVLAGPALRCAAYLVDLALRALLLLVAVVALALSAPGRATSLSRATPGVILLLYFVVEWGYYVIAEGLGQGGTPGKRAFRLRVVRVNGAPVTFTDAMLRNLLRAADILPACYVVGLVVCSLDGRFRRLGDLVAGTMVVREEQRAFRRPVPLAPPPTVEELAAFPPRMGLPRGLQEALEAFAQRTALGPARQDELAASLAPALARHLGMTYRDPVRFLRLVSERLHTPVHPSAGASA